MRLTDTVPPPPSAAPARQAWSRATALACAFLFLASAASAQEAIQAVTLGPARPVAEKGLEVDKRATLPNLVEDPSFEAGRVTTFWTPTNSTYLSGNPIFGPGAGGPDLARTGSWYAILGSGNGPLSTGIQQDITVPAGEYEITFWLLAGIANPLSTSTLTVEFNGEAVRQFGVNDLAGTFEEDYGLVRIPVTVETEGTYTLAFLQENDGTPADPDFINFFIDDVSLDAPANPEASIDTGTLQTALFDNGNIGDTECAAGTGFVFGGEDGLCGAAFVLGLDASTVIGSAYSNGAESEWQPGFIGPASEFPYPALGQGVTASFADTAGIGIGVVANAYWSANTDYVLLEYEITNRSGADLEGVYPGLFIDWDIDQAANQAAVDTERNAFYAFDQASSGQNYFGQVALSGPLAGWSCTLASNSDEDVYAALTTTGPTACAEGDIKGAYSAGAVSIADGASETVTFALVAGTDEADFLANVDDVRSTYNEVALLQINTGTVATRLYTNGNIGALNGGPDGFNFMGVNGLYNAGFLYGFGPDRVISVTGEDEWEAVSVQRPETFPYKALDQGSSVSFEEALTGELEVTLNAYWGQDTDYIVLDYLITNNSFSNYTNNVAGLYMDWDVDENTFGSNVAAVNVERDLQYVFDSSSDKPYFGTMVLGSPLIGWSCFMPYGNESDDALVWQRITAPGANPCEPGDMRGPLGTGPVNINSGQTTKLTFVLLAGDDLDDLLANADAARAAVGLPPVSNETADEAVAAARLTPAYPNPAAGTAHLSLELPAPETVEVSVYDAIGRRVAVLVNGPVAAGKRHLSLDVQSLPAGAYFVRAVGETFSTTQRVTVLR